MPQALKSFFKSLCGLIMAGAWRIIGLLHRLAAEVLGHHALRIDEGDQLVATQHILVERKEGAVLDVGRVD